MISSNPVLAAITEQVIASFENTENPRLREVLESLVKHLHAFAEDTQLSFDEWMAGVQFLTRVGQMCDDKRQEFILLSDTLGLSMFVDAVNHPDENGATETTVLGPFYVPPLAESEHGADIAKGTPGVTMFAECQVFADGKPLADALIDVWQSDDDGYYDVQKPGQIENLRARFRSDAEGRFSFWSIVPTFYPIPDDGPVGDMLKATSRHPYRPAHIHFMIGKEGYETLVTHLFIEGDKYLNSDAVFGVKESLIISLADGEPGTRGDGEHIPAHKRLVHKFGLRKVD